MPHHHKLENSNEAVNEPIPYVVLEILKFICGFRVQNLLDNKGFLEHLKSFFVISITN